VRHLYLADFFSLAKGGFCQFFETVQISYNKLTRIMECALNTENPDIHTSLMIRLVRFLRERKADPQTFGDIFYNLPANCDPNVKECLDQLHFVMTSDDELDHLLAELVTWIEHKVINEGMKSICKDSLLKCVTSSASKRFQFSLVAELMENQLFRFDCLVTARDYLFIMFSCRFMWVLNDRFETSA